jgi:Zn-dependent protease
MDDLSGFLFVASTWVLPVLLAVTFHEAAHGWMADKLGDPTARLAGRISANPIRHVDPFGTVVLPGLLLVLSSPVLFGWAKPVPVDFRRLRNPRWDMVLVAAAGPGSNLLMACIAALLIHGALILMVFNLIPLPPLDGGRIMTGLLPFPLAVRFARLEKFGFLILIGLLFLLPLIGGQIGFDLDVLRWIVATPVLYLEHTLLHTFGIL